MTKPILQEMFDSIKSNSTSAPSTSSRVSSSTPRGQLEASERANRAAANEAVHTNAENALDNSAGQSSHEDAPIVIEDFVRALAADLAKVLAAEQAATSAFLPLAQEIAAGEFCLNGIEETAATPSSLSDLLVLPPLQPTVQAQPETTAAPHRRAIESTEPAELTELVDSPPSQIRLPQKPLLQNLLAPNLLHTGWLLGSANQPLASFSWQEPQFSNVDGLRARTV
ncbi:MAG: hypothetical protein WBD47_01450 [Phormidesmis sp.]